MKSSVVVALIGSTQKKVVALPAVILYTERLTSNIGIKH